MKAKAPWIDLNLLRFQNGPVVVGPEMEATLPDLFESIRPVCPESEDEIRQLWIRAERGTIEDYGDFEEFREEGIVETHEEFKEYWRYEYQRFVYLDHKLALHYTPNPEEQHYQFTDNKLITFLSWLCEEISGEISVIRENSKAYNRSLEKHLPHEKRTGKIERSIFWEIVGNNTFRPDLEKYLEQDFSYELTPGIPEITADGFLRLCEICYQANDYFRDEPIPLSPVEQYRRLADMRHGGLTEIDQDSPEAFREWYHSDQQQGAHPWEICRGGNSTHISLMLSARKKEWILSLAGSSITRVAETAKMAAALYKHGIPFYLQDGKEILNMVQGRDFIGIVPDHVIPRYCHGLFPKEERIIDFMNLPLDFRDPIIQQSSWYPPDKIQLK